MNGDGGTLEYAVSVLGASRIIVCGHTGCGAIRAIMPPEQLDGLPTVKAWLAHAPLDTTPTRAEGSRSPTGPGADAAHAGELAEIDRTVERNVLAQIDPQRTRPHVRDRLEGGGLQLHAWVFDIREGRIRGQHPSTGHVVEL